MSRNSREGRFAGRTRKNDIFDHGRRYVRTRKSRKTCWFFYPCADCAAVELMKRERDRKIVRRANDPIAQKPANVVNGPWKREA